MRKLILMVAVLFALALPTVAVAAPTAQITGPESGTCHGPEMEVTGTASGQQSSMTYTVTVHRTDTNAELFADSVPGWNVNNGILTAFSTTGFPDNVSLRVNLSVQDATGSATVEHTFLPVYDRIKPSTPDTIRVQSVSARQVLTAYTRSWDAGGCAGGIRDYLTGATDDDGQDLLLKGGATQPSGTLSTAVLSAGQTYRVWAQAFDRVGVASNVGSALSVTTPHDFDTRITGRVNGSGRYLFGVRVQATRSDGTVYPATQTDANGIYNLRVAQGVSETYALTFTPQNCLFCSGGFNPASGIVTTPAYIGGIAVRDKTLQATP